MSHHHHHGEYDDPDKSDTNSLFWGFIAAILLFGGVILAFGPAKHHAKAPPPSIVDEAPITPSEIRAIEAPTPPPEISPAPDVATPEVIPQPDVVITPVPSNGTEEINTAGPAPAMEQEHERLDRDGYRGRDHGRANRSKHLVVTLRRHHYHAVEAPRHKHFPETFFLGTARDAGLI